MGHQLSELNDITEFATGCRECSFSSSCCPSKHQHTLHVRDKKIPLHCIMIAVHQPNYGSFYNVGGHQSFFRPSAHIARPSTPVSDFWWRLLRVSYFCILYSSDSPLVQHLTMFWQSVWEFIPARLCSNAYNLKPQATPEVNNNYLG